MLSKDFENSQKQNFCYNDVSNIVNSGKWLDIQNLKYTIFMDFNKKILSSKNKKKYFRFFEQMSKFIGTRNTIQCRSHHQKLEQRFQNFKKIISIVKNQVGKKKYKQYFEKWTNSGKQLIYQLEKKSTQQIIFQKIIKTQQNLAKNQQEHRIQCEIKQQSKDNNNNVNNMSFFIYPQTNIFIGYPVPFFPLYFTS